MTILDRIILYCTWFLVMILMFNNGAHSADFPLPKPRPAPELCLQDGRQPFPGQTLIVDKTCPSGLRWRVQK